MEINKLLREHLISQRDISKEKFKSFEVSKPVHELFNEVFSELDKFSDDEIKQKYIDELILNCKSSWTNPKFGFDGKESIDVLLFEHDGFYYGGSHCNVYGIFGEGFKIQVEEYDYGSDYDFVAGIEANEGVTLFPCQPLINVWANLPSQFDFSETTDDERFMPLINSFKYKNYAILHDVMNDFVESTEFKTLNINKNLHILIGEHDCAAYPIYYIIQDFED